MFLFLLPLLLSTSFSTTVVSSFAPVNTVGMWSLAVTGTGVGQLTDLSEIGGDLYTMQPLPEGAMRMTTGFDNQDRVTVEYVEGFGQPQNEFDASSTLSMQYSVYTSTVAGGNPAATAALRVLILNPSCYDPNDATNDRCFGALIFEPYWNQPGNAGSSVDPPKDVWETYSITANSGVFWWTGGFGQPSGAGGPPLRTLNQWLGTFSSNADFQDASIYAVQIAIGSYNQGVDVYFDDVRISNSNTNLRFDFEMGMIFPQE